jgi:hypothetical protein
MMGLYNEIVVYNLIVRNIPQEEDEEDEEVKEKLKIHKKSENEENKEKNNEKNNESIDDFIFLVESKEKKDLQSSSSINDDNNFSTNVLTLNSQYAPIVRKKKKKN